MELELSDRLLIRIAAKVCEQLKARESGHYAELVREIGHFLTDFDSLHDVQRKLKMCPARSWHVAAGQLKQQVERLSENLPYYAGELRRVAQVCQGKRPALKDVFFDLKQVQEEFGELKYDREEKTLSVVTEPIELEGIYLGDFEIRVRILSLSEGHRDSAFSVVALDPHPAGCNDSVTHPHVRDEALCAGDAAAAIESALSQGRFFDFFVLVRSVLTHYNPNSPFVALESWDGVACYACGDTVDYEETRFCPSCEHDFCENCASYCQRCDETTCLACLQECEACGDRFCSSCMTSCPDCERSICTLCSDEEQCPCHEEEEEEDDSGEEGSGTEVGKQTAAPDATPAEARESSQGDGAPVHPHSMGEAHVLP